ncbi:MAG TPA: alanine--tRNA ligase [Planctomycetes bacterium]|nr:alanine--tRNA ligase [Planctomycetota bacterium]
MKTAKEIRATFLDFFAERGHRIVPSSPVVPQNDPTLLFINAGMNQFKDVFLGTGSRDYTRAADTQKCIRVSGKHNDLEEVGVDGYHHTFFEMLGNWSFGDYFKEDAIRWAWELLVDVYGLDPDRLWVTVFGGDEKDGLEADEEAEELWPKVTGIAPERVLRFGKKDNFWEMGETGPCGPCTEIHYDRGPELGECPTPGDPSTAVNADTERVIEIWNLVFIQFNRNPDGSLSPLPARHVDTGMGFERLVSVMQGARSNYDTDLFQPIIQRLSTMAGVPYEASDSASDVACRVVADHVRTLSIAFADGVLPGNEGRGYVLRRILRRAARFGRQSLGLDRPFIHALVPEVVGILGETFPEVAAQEKHIRSLIEAEEKAFQKTLDRGLQLYAKLAADVKAAGATTLDGEAAFDLYATYGFPRDLVELMAREDGLTVESKGWDAAEARHREASKSEGTFGFAFDLRAIEGLPATQMLCYREGQAGTGDGVSTEAKVLALIDERFLVLDKSPFYAESGGQVGDAGVIESEGEGCARFEVEDTQRYGDILVHVGKVVSGSASDLEGRTVHARVDLARRRAIMRNHTGTHLLHKALRDVLGDHVQQQGSLVAPDRLRFDFTHPKAMTQEEIEAVEAKVNDVIEENIAVVTTVEDLDAARARGVTALFGEKYDEKVRVVDVPGFSTELCGGTHCGATGEIGLLLVSSEGAVQAGVRRIEAVTGAEAVRRVQEQRRLLRQAATALKTKPGELPERVAALRKKVKILEKGGSGGGIDRGGQVKALLSQAEEVEGARVVTARLDAGPKDLAAVADLLRNQHAPVCGLLAGEAGGKVMLCAFASKDLVGRGVHAGRVIKEAAALLGGGGGGRPDFAQAGGKNAAKIDDALALAGDLFQASLNARKD